MQLAAGRASGAVWVAGMCVALAACGGDGGSTEPKSPAELALATGGAQTGVAGAKLVQAIGIRVTTSSGEALAGVTVSFAARANSGSLSAAAPKTNASGVASTMWTLGGKAGVDSDTLEASVSGLPDKTIIVTASAMAAAPTQLMVISGDAQVGNPGEEATEPLVVAVRDEFGNPNEGIEVSWSVEGGGSLSAASDTTDAAGHASVLWTLGPGDNRVSATIAELSEVVTPFTAALTASEIVKLFAVSPNPLVEGGSATLTGSGFSTTLTANRVFVDGVVAQVTAASESSIQITIPTFDCRPTRPAPVRVVVGSEGSNAVEQTLVGTGTSVSLALGEQLIVRDPTKFCLQLDASASPAAYLVGAQSVSELASSLTLATMSAAAAPSQLLAFGASPQPLQSRMMLRGPVMPNVLTSPRAQRWLRHRSAEAKLRSRERQLVRNVAGARISMLRSPAPVATSGVPASVSVGDTVSIKFPDINSDDFCTTSIPIKTVVRAKGTKGIWLEDVTDPAGGYTGTDFGALSDEFDNEIYATDVAYFGEPTDFDGNGRVVIVTSKEVNKVSNVLGFVVTSDLPPFGCASSNGGEFYYGRAPDPNGDYRDPAPYELAQAKDDAPLLIAHEFTHVIQFGRRLTFPGAESFQSQWEAEGQATLAQEVVGHDLNGLAPGNNYQFDKIADGALGDATDWYGDAFIDLAIYFGYKGSGIHSPNAPDQCTWLGQASGAPCISGREVYGVPWSFLRWISDQFGPSFAGGEKGLQRALIDNAHTGYQTIQDVTGVEIDSLLAQWAATLYVDDYWDVPSSANHNPNPRLSFTSWDLPDIFLHLPPEASLAPREHGFLSFSDAVSVRGGSTAYFRISGSAAPATAVKLRDASGLPFAPSSPMQLWIVRLQ